jgi:hypothetical protein
MNIIEQLEQMKDNGKLVVSIEFVLNELRGIPPTRQQTSEKAPQNDFNMRMEHLHVECVLRSITG